MCDSILGCLPPAPAAADAELRVQHRRLVQQARESNQNQLVATAFLPLKKQ